MIDIRPAADEDLPAAAQLRWQWVLDNGGTPVCARAEFVRRFVEWARAHDDSHACLVAVRDRVVVGMAWLAVVPRVPTPTAPDRASGDVQCVYVMPEHRDEGIGGMLLSALLLRARTLGLERVTVHSSTRAIPAYERAGFAASPQLLQIRPG